MRGISLLVAQLFVIAIENILWVCVGNLTRLLITPYALQKTLGRFSSKKCFFVCYHEKEEGSSYWKYSKSMKGCAAQKLSLSGQSKYFVPEGKRNERGGGEGEKESDEE